MNRLDLPANIWIMELTPAKLNAIRPVTALDIFDGATDNFHENGLFSTSIFGRVGSDERDKRFSYINVKVKVFHPFIFKQLCTLKALYSSIMSRKAYAVWDDVIKDFVASDVISGSTGYNFFMSHWEDIVYKRTGSDIRDLKIQLIEKYKKVAVVDKVLVMPAGLRDIQRDDNGKVKQGEINEHYRSLISASNAISASSNLDTPILDTTRFSIQMSFNRVYEYITGLLEGKGGFLQDKWASRRVFNGTRNVITAMDTSSSKLDDDNSPGVNNTVIGLYQLLKAALPIAKYQILNGWLSKIMNTTTGEASLVNVNTWRAETVKLSHDVLDLWTTTAGIDKMINRFSEVHNRSRPLKINGRFVGLVYLGDDNTFKVFGDVRELPNDPKFTRDRVHPITLTELFYLAGYRKWNTLPMYVTRYPVTGVGSIYPSLTYVKTTVKGEMRRELGDDWLPMDKSFTALEYPTCGSDNYVDSLVPHPSRLGGLGGDFDGDTVSANVLYTDESIADITKRLDTASAYVSPRGGLVNSSIVATVSLVLKNFTGDGP